LKLEDWKLEKDPFRLSEQHPREQGLKHEYLVARVKQAGAFQSNIQENKD